jgi:hypothetical protein
VVDLRELLSKINFDRIRLPGEVEQRPITQAAVSKALGVSPRRICFASTHRAALKTNPAGSKYVGSFSVPFTESIYPIFHEMTSLELFKSKFQGWWRSVQSQDELEEIKRWIEFAGPLVFLRDTLALSVALAENQLPEGGRSPMGELEYRAKWHRDRDAIDRLIQAIVKAVRDLPFYRDAELICAVPPRPGKAFDLPSLLSERVAAQLGKRDITAQLTWGGEKPSLKEIAVEDKWARLEAVGLRCGTPVANQRVLLIDDLYQSGVTLQFVAKTLVEAGARHIYGLAIVKSRGDSDNV